MINDSINRFLGVLCYPFVSLKSFRRDLILEYRKAMVEPADGGKKAAKIKKQLQREVLDHIRDHYNLYSYDEIYLYLEKCYLYQVGEYDDVLDLYQSIVEKMATTLISQRDGRIVFKYWKNKEDEELFGGFAGNNKVTLFHSLNCHIPMDVVAIVYMVKNQKVRDSACLDLFYGNIEVADQQLSRVLEKGVSENHLHKGVSRTFSSIWNTMMKPVFCVSDGKKLKGNLRGYKDANRICCYILGCGIVRVWLALKLSGKLWERTDLDEKNGFNEEVTKQTREIDDLVERFCDGEAFDAYYRTRFENNEDEMFVYYTQMWNTFSRLYQRISFDGNFCMQIFEENMLNRTYDENVFLFRTIYAILGKVGDARAKMEEKDHQGRKCLFQYLRVRSHLFHESVQQKTIKGLDYFQSEHYSFNSDLNRINVENYWENAIREQLQNPDIKKIEFRTSPSNNYYELKKSIKNFLDAYYNILLEDYCDDKKDPCRPFPRVGLVFHFLKKPDNTIPQKCLHNGMTDCSYLTYGPLHKTYQRQMSHITKLREEFGELSSYLVGIDAASLENATPVWVFAPIYEMARDSRVEPLGRNKNDWKYMQSLGFTFHAGEDFRHILSGLRRIDEAVEFLKFHAGDRIGHGIALGISPEKWKIWNPVIVIPQIEALENYLWAYSELGKNYSEFQASILAYMENRIFELAEAIYGDMNGITTEGLIRGYRMLFTGEMFEKMDETIKEEMCQKVCRGEKICWNARLLAASRHCIEFVKAMEKPIHYEITEQDLLITQQMQKIVRRKLGEKGVVVEANPSSNTAIADLDVNGENQFYQLNQLYDDQNLMVCINSDDPTVFNTNVSNELAYIYYGMLEKNISREAALQWIDRIRETGMNSSFIRNQDTDKMLLDNLKKLIDNL